MKEDFELLTISEFSEICGLSRKTLIYYDTIDLFSPEHIADNKYRYYSPRQIDTAILIQTLKELDMPLKEIKIFLKTRTPEKAEIVLKNQQQILKRKIAALKTTEQMINVRLGYLHEGIHCKFNKVQLVDMRSVPIIVGKDINRNINHISSEDWTAFYNFCIGKNISPGYSIGYKVSAEDFTKSNFRNVEAFFLRLFNSDHANSEIVQGKYLVSYGRTNYNLNNVKMCELINEYVTENKQKICSDIYYEYILDEITTSKPSDYLIKVSVQVE